MAMLQRSFFQFLLIVIVPLILAGGGVVLLTADLVDRLSAGANAEDHRRTTEVVGSAIDSSLEQLANIVADNANWDDAAVILFAKEIDESFVVTSWGDTSATGVNYDAMLATDAHGTVLTAYLRGERFNPDPATYFSGGLAPLLAELPQNNTESATAARVLQTPQGLAAVAAGNLVPTTASIDLGTAEPRFLVLVKFLDPSFVARIGEKFVVQDLTLAEGPQGPAGFFNLTDGSGNTLGVMSWKDRRPGDVVNGSVRPVAAVLISTLILVLAALALLCWRQYRHIDERERRARFDARHDSLTALPNRQALIEAIAETARQAHSEVCVVFIDLDGFKEVNDTYDHETGDRLIKAVAAGFGVLGGDNALVSRLGGDEFVILLSGKDCLARAQTLARQAIAFLASPFNLEGRIALVGGSIGIACAVAGTVTPNELMRRADIAMYQAKSGGKNRWCVFHRDMDALRNETADLARDLRAILDEGRIDVAYQPIVDAASLAIAGVEALARWPASSPRIVGPDVFIPIAESAGLINQLGKAVLARACADAKQWPDIRISVNVSPVQFRDPDFVAQCLAIIDDSGIARRRIEMEVTEGTLIDDVCRLRPVFESLRKAGLSIALDDFGSGYSSIAYLRDLTFDRIKIDRSLTKSLLTSSMARNVIQATGLIAHGISAAVTAEGVETGEELQLLRLAGCSEFQGYFFSRPQTAAAITAAVQGGQRLSDAA